MPVSTPNCKLQHCDWHVSQNIAKRLAKKGYLKEGRKEIMDPVISVTEVNLARIPRALEGEVKGGVASRGAGKGRLWRKGSRKGVD